MNADHYIESTLSLNNSHVSDNVNWSSVKPKPQKVYHGRGHKPYIPGCDVTYNTRYTNLNRLRTNHSDTGCYSQSGDPNYLDSQNSLVDSTPLYYEWDAGYPVSPQNDQWVPENSNPPLDPWSLENFPQLPPSQWNPESLVNPNTEEWYQENAYSYPYNYSSEPFIHPYFYHGYSENCVNFEANQEYPENTEIENNISLNQHQTENKSNLDKQQSNLKKLDEPKQPKNISRNLTINSENRSPKKKCTKNNNNFKNTTESKKDLNEKNEKANLDFVQEVPNARVTKSGNRKKKNYYRTSLENSSKLNSSQTTPKKFTRTPFLRQKEIDKMEKETIQKDKKKEDKEDKEEENEKEDLSRKRNDVEFPEIIPRVREITGGWNVQSNEAIEQRHRERQRMYLEQNNADNNSSNESFVTLSSDLNESFHTAVSYESWQAQQQSILEEKLNESEVCKYKTNALIAGLYNTTKESENDDSEEDEAYVDAVVSPSDKVVHEMVKNFNNLEVNDQQNEVDEELKLRAERLGRFLFRSEEDEDVYVHPLREQIKKDSEWKKFSLSRKGTTEILSSRQYYINVDDDDFNFVIPTKSK